MTKRKRVRQSRSFENLQKAIQKSKDQGKRRVAGPNAGWIGGREVQGTGAGPLTRALDSSAVSNQGGEIK